MENLLEVLEPRVVPWKNGQGFTTELYIDPPGADFAREPFFVRMSSATVASPHSTFSLFPGCRRVLVALDGSLRLRHGNGEENERVVALSPLVPHCFDGGEKTECELTGAAPVTDFNLISQERDEWSVAVFSSPFVLALQKDDFLFVCFGSLEGLASRQLARATRDGEKKVDLEGTSVIRVAKRGK
jgi:environmental stress-induced protein Ves